MTPKPEATQRKRDKLDFMKILEFCALKDPINRVKQQPKWWKKMLANNISYKRLTSKI